MEASSSHINIDVTLDEDRVPSKITWTATDQPGMDSVEAKAFILALFEKEHKDTMRVDLWTKEMQVVEMDRFFYHTIKSMADTYMRATGNNKLAGALNHRPVRLLVNSELQQRRRPKLQRQPLSARAQTRRDPIP